MIRTVANNFLFNLFKKKMELTFKIKVFPLFRHIGWTWTDPDLHKTTKKLDGTLLLLIDEKLAWGYVIG